MQAGVLGGYMRVASVACFDAGAGGVGNGDSDSDGSPFVPRGFEMLSLGPLRRDNDTVLVDDGGVL